jgi:hypothetical protein
MITVSSWPNRATSMPRCGRRVRLSDRSSASRIHRAGGVRPRRGRRPTPPTRSRGQHTAQPNLSAKLDRGEHRHTIQGGGTPPQPQDQQPVYTDNLTSSASECVISPAPGLPPPVAQMLVGQKRFGHRPGLRRHVPSGRHPAPPNLNYYAFSDSDGAAAAHKRCRRPRHAEKRPPRVDRTRHPAGRSTAKGDAP